VADRVDPDTRRRRPLSALDFTVLLPVWAGDEASLFEAAARSVTASSLQPVETLICQDGPVPPALADAIARVTARGGFRLVVNPGARGLHHNLNHAAAEVRTPWIARMDADDLNLPERFAAQARRLAEDLRVDVLGGAILETAPDGSTRRRTVPLDHAAIVRRARWRSPTNHMTVMMRLAPFLACGGYPDIARKEDYGLWLVLLAKGARFANLPQDLVQVRLGSGFEARRAGLQSLSSELELFRLRGRLEGLGGPTAMAALLARGAALASRRLSRVLYRRLLRQGTNPSEAAAEGEA
jgi:glycosyltransferase involved in cell wall biosynthesis